MDNYRLCSLQPNKNAALLHIFLICKLACVSEHFHEVIMSMYMLNKQAAVQLLVLAPHYGCNETKPASRASVAHQVKEMCPSHVSVCCL